MRLQTEIQLSEDVKQREVLTLNHLNHLNPLDMVQEWHNPCKSPTTMSKAKFLRTRRWNAVVKVRIVRLHGQRHRRRQQLEDVELPCRVLQANEEIRKDREDGLGYERQRNFHEGEGEGLDKGMVYCSIVVAADDVSCVIESRKPGFQPWR